MSKTKEVYYAPSNAALVVFMRKFPFAGANMSGLAVDFEGDRGDPEVVKEAKKHFEEAGWVTRVSLK